MNKLQSSIAKGCPLFLFEQLRVTKSPGFRLASPGSSSNKGQNEVSFLNLNLDIAKMLSSLWEFLISMLSWVKN